MKRLGIFAAAFLAMGAAVTEGCGGGGENSGGSGGNPSSTGTGGKTSSSGSGGTGGGGAPQAPKPPALGAQIDRFGRPAINTALDHTFDNDATAAGMAKDTWNADGDPSKWAGAYAGEVAKNLAIIDGIDTMCGNQTLAKQPANPGDPIPADRYMALAAVLADDRLWIDTSQASCNLYLGVEAHAALPGVPADCGGRTLKYDVIDQSYSMLAAGAFQGVIDGVAPDMDVEGTTFPYLAPPH